MWVLQPTVVSREDQAAHLAREGEEADANEIKYMIVVVGLDIPI